MGGSHFRPNEPGAVFPQESTTQTHGSLRSTTLCQHPDAPGCHSGPPTHSHPRHPSALGASHCGVCPPHLAPSGTHGEHQPNSTSLLGRPETPCRRPPRPHTSPERIFRASVAHSRAGAQRAHRPLEVKGRRPVSCRGKTVPGSPLLGCSAAPSAVSRVSLSFAPGSLEFGWRHLSSNNTQLLSERSHATGII